MSDTPRTAKAWGECLNWITSRDMAHDPQHAALANLAEDLERELSAVNAKITELENHLSPKPIDDSGPAFPFGQISELTGQPINGYFAPGMTLRVWLAGMAMQGLLASGHFTTPETEEENQAWMKTHEDPWDDETGERLEFPAIKFDFPEAAFRCADSMLEYGKEDA